jgi:hypothetical protein
MGADRLVSWKDHAHIVAELALFPTEHGGRTDPTPRHIFMVPFVYEGERFNCGLLLDECGPLSPGARALVPIQFLRPELIVPRLQEGSQFDIWELRTIGKGVVREILRHDFE